MTPRAVLVSWAVAGLCLLVFILSILTAKATLLASCPVPTPKAMDSHIIVIGSSLTEYAFATDPDATGPLANATVWWRPWLGPDEGLMLLRCALDTEAQHVLVEASTFAFEGTKPGLTAKLAKLGTLPAAFTEDVRALIGQALLGEPDPRIGSPAAALSSRDWDGTRPPKIAPPSVPIHLAWVAPLRDISASHPGRVALFDLPRTALHLQDTAQDFDPAKTLTALAKAAGLPLILTDLVWEPSMFTDYHSHMHPRGRARFQKAFLAAWSVRSDAH